MTGPELDGIMESLLDAASSACCRDAPSRGLSCDYHQGYEDGMERIVLWLLNAHELAVTDIE